MPPRDDDPVTQADARAPLDAAALRFRPLSAREPIVRGNPWIWAFASLAVAVLAVLALRRPIADRIWPEARVQALHAQGERALAEGRLSAADGSGARESFEAELAMDPDRRDARDGLARVAQAALAQARAATVRNRFDEAHRALRLARTLSAPRAQADDAANALRTREAAHAGVDRLVAEAEAARKAGRLDGDAAAALPLYARVIGLQPDRTDALKGREDALAELLQRARAALQRGALAQGAAAIAAARGFDAGHVDLAESEAALARATERARQDADAALRDDRLAEATGLFKELLASGADDAAAMRGLERVAAAHAQRARREATDFRFDQAASSLAQARALSPQLDAVREAERDLARARQARTRLGPRLSPAERERRVVALLADAAAAEARGDLLAPPGDSAYDKLRAARAIAPDDARVRRAGARLLPAARDCFERELQGNRLHRARACLDARVALEGGGTALTAARRRLALRWLAVGDERLGAGDLVAAKSAFDTARGLDARVPGLDEFGERVRAATAAP